MINEEPLPDKAVLDDLQTVKMPYGKYKGQLIINLLAANDDSFITVLA